MYAMQFALIARIGVGSKIYQKKKKITISSVQLYEGTEKGIILVYQNESLINKLNGSDGKSQYLKLKIEN